MKIRVTSLVITALLLSLAGILYAEDGITDKEIVLGQSCALAGPAQALGTGMRAGLQAAFAEANEAGGIHGRSVRLVSKDDGYEPDKAIANTTQLIEKDKVFLLIGEVGTPTSKAVVPMAERAKVPFFGPFTGAEFLRNPFKKYVVNLRGSYNQEMEALTAYLVDKKGLKTIACLYQNDGYGKAGLNGLVAALKKRSMELSATGTYERNTTAVKAGLLKIRRAKPDAVVMVGAYKPCAEFIRLAKKVGMKKTVYCNISFVGTKALHKELGDAGEGCIISQVVTFPEDQSVPIVKAHLAAMKRHQAGTEPGFVSLEGYAVGRLFCEVANIAGKNLTRENFLSAIGKTGKFDLGGMVLEFGKTDHQGMDKIFLTIIKGGKIQPLNP